MITAGLLESWALRSTVLIVSGALLVKALRVKDPSVRLAACTAMLVGSLAIPLLTVALPAMPVKTRTTVDAPAQDYRAATGPVPAGFRRAEPLPITVKQLDWSRAAVLVYLIVAGGLFVRISIGMVLSLQILHRSRPTERAGVRESGRIDSPVTLGIFRPAILLPSDWRAWQAAQLEAVLAHERAHIRRYDPAVQALSAIHRALLWYSPLSWYLDRQIVRLAEEASDDAAVAAIHDRVSYAETLLEFVQRGAGRASLPGVPMARYGSPERRIHRILDSSTLSRGVTRWGVAAILALGLPLAYVIAAAQERPEFEAASVKPAIVPEGITVSGTSMTMQQGNREDFQRYRSKGGPGTTDPGRIHYPLVSLTGLLHRAFDSTYFEIVVPGWADTDIVSVDASMPPNTTKEQFQRMLQNLIVDRFGLKTHVETRQINGYALVVAKNGPKLKESLPQEPEDAPSEPAPHKIGPDGWPIPPAHLHSFGFQGLPGERARMLGEQRTAADLAQELGHLLDSKVVDATGLQGKYDITLTYAGHLGGPNGVQALLQSPPPSADPSAPEPLPDIFSALQSQLGLKLERQKVPVEILVVDYAEKTPIGN